MIMILTAVVLVVASEIGEGSRPSKESLVCLLCAPRHSASVKPCMCRIM